VHNGAVEQGRVYREKAKDAIFSEKNRKMLEPLFISPLLKQLGYALPFYC